MLQVPLKLGAKINNLLHHLNFELHSNFIVFRPRIYEHRQQSWGDFHGLSWARPAGPIVADGIFFLWRKGVGTTGWLGTPDEFEYLGLLATQYLIFICGKSEYEHNLRCVRFVSLIQFIWVRLQCYHDPKQLAVLVIHRFVHYALS